MGSGRRSREGQRAHAMERGPSGAQGRRATDDATSPVKCSGFGKAARVEAPFSPSWKQSGGRQRKWKIQQNAAARGAAAQGSHDAGLQAVVAQSVQAEQDRVERHLRVEVEEAKQLAAAIRASMEQGIVGSQSRGATEDDEVIEEEFRQLCEAAGVAPEDVYRTAAQSQRASETVEEVVFRRKCRRAGDLELRWLAEGSGSS